MFRIDLALQEASDRQAALRRSARLLPRRRPSSRRRQVGAWIVRVGRVVAGRSGSRTAWQA